MKSTAWVTRIRVLSFIRPTKTSLNTFLRTSASRAEIGSSMTSVSGRLYTARAKASLAFYPPDKLMPLSPSSLKSPADIKAKSDSSWQARTVSTYFFSSKSEPKRMFYRIVAFYTQTYCSQRLVLPFIMMGLLSVKSFL